MFPSRRDADEQGLRWTLRVRGGRLAGLLGTWGLTRLVLLLFVFKVFVFPGPDVTTDVSVIYQGWYETLRHGTFPLDDVTWQYPPAAALAILSPALLGFLEYTKAFFVLAFLADLVVLSLLAVRGPAPRQDAARRLGVGGGRTAARPDRVRTLRRDGHRGGRGRAARGRPASAA